MRQFDIEKIDALLQEASIKIETSQDQDLVLVIGNTGAGKSTTVNYLLDYPMKKTREGAVPLNPKVPPPAQMGKGSESITTFPISYKSNKGYIFCDCPGFIDTRGEEIRVSISMSIEAVVSKAKCIRSLIVVIDHRSFELQRGAAIKEIAITLSTLIKDLEHLDQSILFLINRAEPDVDKECLIEQINEIIEAESNNLKKLLNKTSHLNEVSNLQKTLVEKGIELLKLMKLNPNNLILLDIFDNGRCRDLIIEQLTNKVPIPINNFDFISSDEVRRDFENFIINQIKEVIELENREQNILENVKIDKEKFQSLERLILNCEQTIRLLDRSSTKDFPRLAQVAHKRDHIEKNNICTTKMQKELTRLKEEKVILERELTSLDISDEVLFTVIEYTSESKMFGATKQRFKYSGARFTRAEADYKASSGNFKIKQYKPENGIYYSKYKANAFSDKKASVKIFGRKKDKPENKERIIKLKNSITMNESFQRDLEENLIKLIEINNKLYEEISILIGEHNDEISYKKHESLNLKSKCELELIAIEKNIKEKVDEGNKIVESLKSKLPILQYIKKVIVFVNLKNKEIIALYQQFIECCENHNSFDNLSGVSNFNLLSPNMQATIFKEQLVKPLPLTPKQQHDVVYRNSKILCK